MEPHATGAETQNIDGETQTTYATQHIDGETRAATTKAEAETFPVATVHPLDVTGVRTVAVGAGLWLGALVALLPFYSSLQEQGRGWWLWTCGAGFGLGLIGLEYCRRRRHRLAKQPDREVETSPLGAAGF